MRRRVAGAAMLLTVIAGCAGDEAPAPEAGGNAETPEDPANEAGEQADQHFPDVIDAQLSATGKGRYEIAVTRGPFAIPERVTEVTVEGRDLEHGYGGETVTIDVPR